MGVETQDTQLLIKKVKLFEAIVNKSQNAVIVFNDQLEVSFSNLAAAEMLQEASADLRGRHLSEFIPTHIRTRHETQVRQFRDSNEVRQDLNDWRRIECCRPNGQLFPASITIDKFSISGKELYIVSMLDMTAAEQLESKKSEAEMNYFKAVQQKKYAAETLQNHVQKNITQIAKTAQGIKDTYNLDPISDAMTSIMQHAFSTLSLSQKAIFISEIMKDQAGLNLVDRSLYGAFERLRLMVENQVDKRLSLDGKIPAYTRKVKLKHDQAVEQILYNLLDDASSYTINGKVGLEINRIEAVDDDHVLMEICVKNPHHGIPQHLMDAILSCNRTVPIAREYNLHLDGLCLRLAKHQTEQLGGQFRVITQPVGGTEVYIKLTLPVMNGEAAKINNRLEPERADTVPEASKPEIKQQRPISASDVLSGDQVQSAG